MKTLYEFFVQDVAPIHLVGKSKSHQQRFTNCFDRFLGDLKNKPIDQIKRSDILVWFRALSSKTPINANRYLSYLSSVMNHAVDFELIPHNLCKGIKRNRENTRKRFASPLEFKKMFMVLDNYKEKYPNQVAFIKLLAYTGARPTEIERMKWRDLKSVNGVYVLEHSHGKRGDTTIVFPPEATAIINGLNPLSRTVINVSLKSTHRVWYKIRAELGAEDLWLRDLRRTFATRAFSKGMGLGIVGELLNHKSPSSTKVYARLMLNNRIEAVNNLAQEITNSAEDLFE